MGLGCAYGAHYTEKRSDTQTVTTVRKTNRTLADGTDPPRWNRTRCRVLTSGATPLGARASWCSTTVCPRQRRRRCSGTSCRQYATPLLIREGIFLTYSFFLLEVDRATRDTTRDTHVTHRRQQEQTGAWRVWRPNQATPQQADDDRHEPVCSLRLGTWLDDY